MKKFSLDFKTGYRMQSLMFKEFSNAGLVAFCNLQVENNMPEEFQQGMLFALVKEFEQRKIDFLAILDESPNFPKHCVVLLGNQLYKITELPRKNVEGLVKMLLKSQKAEYKAASLIYFDEEEIFYALHDKQISVSSNTVVSSFTESLLNASQ